MDLGGTHDYREDKVTALEGRIAELEKDKARMDWLESNTDLVIRWHRANLILHCGTTFRGTVRDAIDEAKDGE